MKLEPQEHLGDSPAQRSVAGPESGATSRVLGAAPALGELATLWSVIGVLFAGLLAYSQTLAFAWDEGFHLLAAQLILRGERPYLDFLFPQTPLAAYLNAAAMRIFGESWRVPHVMAALATAAAAGLTGDFVLRRMQDVSWRLAAALCAVVLVAANSTVLWFATIGQPYGVCLLLVVAAFRLTIRAAERKSPPAALGAGLCAGAAAACSLLTAPFAVVLLGWTWLRAGESRVKSCAAFVAGIVPPFLPLAWLFVHAPQQVIFGVLKYHGLYRDADWPDAGKQNLDVATAWMGNYEAAALIGLAALGLTYMVGRSGWAARLKDEFYLCLWIAAAEGAYLMIPRPTFARYYLFDIPFVAILAAIGLYAIASSIGSLQMPWRYPLALALVLISGAVKYTADAREDFTWPAMEQVAAKVDAVTPARAALYADEETYFLTRRQPPSGMEYADSHKVPLPEEQAAKMHLIPLERLDKEVAAGRFATIEICDDEDRIEELKLPGPYRQKAEIDDCTVFWDRK